jgi:hypothetical protein
MPFEVLQAGGPAVTSTLAAAQPRIRLSVGCGAARSEGRGRRARAASCTITTGNGGQDGADFTRVDIATSSGLTQPRTTAGRPPAVLGPGQSAQMTVQFALGPGATRGMLTVTVSGRDETDRLPFSVSGSADVTAASRAH